MALINYEKLIVLREDNQDRQIFKDNFISLSIENSGVKILLTEGDPVFINYTKEGYDSAQSLADVVYSFFDSGESSIQIANSDSTYTQTLTPADSPFPLPDITITLESGSEVSWPSVKDYTATALGIGYIPIPFPENTTQYAVGDARWQVTNNIWDRTVLGITPLPSNNDTLLGTTLNAFGNTNVWTDEDGLQVYGNNYAINHLYGIGFYLTVQGVDIWEDAIANSQSASITVGSETYTDWYVPNAYVYSLLFRRDGGGGSNLNFSPISITSANLWTSESGQVASPATFKTAANPTSSSSLGERNRGLTANYIYIRRHY
jgi:hypothetical protein